MGSHDNNEDIEAINKQNFSKLSAKIEKIGYQDGIHEGRESQFQTGFDTGYENGFENGFLLGTYKGSYLAMQQPKHDSTVSSAKQKDLILERTSRGHCVICTDQNLINVNISSIVELQRKEIGKTKSTLEQRYTDVKK